jgi:hypothetical protein
MSALDYTSPWKLTSTYPIFQRESNTTASLPTVDTLEATGTTGVQTQQITVKINATTNGSRVGPGYTINVSDPDGLAELTDATALTDQNGTATFTFAEPNAGTFDPQFAAARESTATTSASVEIEYGTARTYTREDGTELSAVYSGNGTVDSPYEINSLADLQAIDNSTTAHSNQYELITDIDASGTEASSWNGGRGFESIANATARATDTRSRISR